MYGQDMAAVATASGHLRTGSGGEARRICRCSRCGWRESPTVDRSVAAITTTRCLSIGSGGFREREGPNGSTKNLDRDLRRRWTSDLCRRWWPDLTARVDRERPMRFLLWHSCLSKVEGKYDISHLQNFQFFKNICILQTCLKKPSKQLSKDIMVPKNNYKQFRPLWTCGNEVENRQVITPHTHDLQCNLSYCSSGSSYLARVVSPRTDARGTLWWTGLYIRSLCFVFTL
jgi:hypothetical protein